MLDLIVYGLIAGFAGIVLLGHILLFQALIACGENKKPTMLPTDPLRSRA